ncbi:hypothetical protein Poli38472_012172 [Pythium oligandrum]|uniref:Uncharacterized protein n=1 Tax=Pythium oligandrum TaxID=41045 RepID=A0A8K1CNT7_PYTOL|nr:hypothetical protein Poli38472_012172 [Pythium oligandrum]|eukprot:TMW67056.1 hypothetical protein Poli38472_012172 [Pythium oligandrum]
MKDEFKALVPTAPSARRTPPSVAVTSHTRLSDGERGARGLAQASPRTKLLQQSNVEASAPPQQSTASQQDGDNVSKTFLTALDTPKQRANEPERPSKGHLLRPPSPLEAADAGKVSRISDSEPVVANYVGGDAVQKFWQLFHREDAVMNTHSVPTTRQEDHRALVLPTVGDRPRSARTTYLAAVRKLHLTPEPMGIVRRRANEKGLSSSVSATSSSNSSCTGGNSTQEINLSSYHMGDAYGMAFSESFALVPGVEALNIASNRISDDTAARILTNALQSPVISTLQALNLSNNALGSKAARAVATLLRTSKTLVTLNLTQNRLKDRDITLLCDALQKNQTLARVHLSKNTFGIPGMVAIAKFLEENAKIEEVYLAWNNIRGLGALKLAEALKFHASLRVLDVSWNALHSNELLAPRAIITALSDSIANNKVLAHLDLSNNHLDMEDCGIFARYLAQNQTLIGLHMSGNCGIMDTRGFLIPKQTTCKLLDQHKPFSIAVFEEAMNETGSGSVPSHLVQLVDKYCWYCGQWSEYRFAWQPTATCGPFAGSDRSTITSDMIVKLHVSHDDWRGIEMDRRDDGSFSAYRILPPGKTEYFFTVTDKNDPHKVSYHYIKEKRHTRLVHHLAGRADATFGTLSRVNQLRNARREGRDPCNTMHPRTAKTNERVSRWDINRSVFSRRRRETLQHSFTDTDAFIQKACAADWRQGKVDRFVKDASRRKEVEMFVTKNFRTISNIYRKYCGHNILTSLAAVAAITPTVANQLQNDIISVPWSGYMEFLSEGRILDENSEYCRYADLENVFVAANLELTQEAKEKDNPDRSLTRFEFLEVVIRIAINKFHRTGVSDTPVRAVEKLLLEHLVPICPEDPNEFRTRFLYTEEVSEIFSEHIVLLQDVYNSNMGKFCKPGEKKGMQLVEFLTILEKYQVYNDIFRIRDVKDPFLACKLVVLDEMATVGHKKLLMTDFMEVLLRIAVLRYPPRPVALAEVAKSLQKLFLNHFYRHEAMLEQFRDTVDQAVVQQRIEEFADAINGQTRKGRGRGKRGSSARSSKTATTGIAETSDEDSDDSDDDETNDDPSPPVAISTESQESEMAAAVIADADASEASVTTDTQPVDPAQGN